MKLQAKSRELSVALQKSSRCINSKNTIVILDNVLLSKHDDGELYFTSSTNDSQLTIPAPLTVCEGQFGKPIALPVKLVSQFLTTLPDCTVTLDFLEDEKTLQLDYCTSSPEKTKDGKENVKEGKVTLPYFDGEEYPKMAAPKEANLHIVLPADKLLNVINKSGAFIAVSELRPVMMSLCIDVAEDMSELFFVGTDGHALLKVHHSNDPARGGSDFFRGGEPGAILIHMQYFRTLAAFSGLDEIDITTDRHTIRFASGSTEFLCKAVDGKYPNYNSVIPKNNPYYICFDKKEMLAILKRVRLFGSESNDLVELCKDGMFLNLRADDIDFGRGAEDQVVLTDAECADQFRIGFKGAKLIDCLNAIDADEVRLALLDKTRAGVMTANVPSPDTLALLMPMLLND